MMSVQSATQNESGTTTVIYGKGGKYGNALCQPPSSYYLPWFQPDCQLILVTNNRIHTYLSKTITKLFDL